MERATSAGAAVLALIVAPLQGWGAVVPISPFVGTYSESWESFPLYNQTPGTYMTSGTPVFGGAATIVGNRFAVYRPGGGDGGWSFQTSGQANVFDGTKGVGYEGAQQTGTFRFASPLQDFGGYWGAATGPAIGDPSTVQIRFLDALGVILDSTQFTYSRSATVDGQLLWQGWHSTVPFSQISFTGFAAAGDAFQANPVPAPAGALLLAGVVVATRRRR